MQHHTRVKTIGVGLDPALGASNEMAPIGAISILGPFVKSYLWPGVNMYVV